jgi:hypothetical protein
MRVVFAGLALAALLTAAACAAPADTKEQAGQAAALSWLKLIDDGDYAGSWEQAAAHFREAVPKERWIAQVGVVRRPFGAVKSRHALSERFTRSLPGAPDGEYVVVQFSTSFEHKAEATETVTPMKDADGQWRVSGYYLK